MKKHSIPRGEIVVLPTVHGTGGKKQLLSRKIQYYTEVLIGPSVTNSNLYFYSSHIVML